MTKISELLKLNDNSIRLNIPEQTWRKALGSATVDKTVCIRHSAIAGDASFRTHVAAIPSRVNCHVHQKGREIYEIVEGKGVLRYGQASKTRKGFEVNWAEPLPVKQGDCFVIPEGYAHQLVNQGNKELIILFGCPDSHLDTNQDRAMLQDHD